MSNASNSLTVTAVSLGDSKVITAFFNQLPGLVVQGDSVNDVKVKLHSVLQTYIKKLQSINDFDVQPQNFA